MATGIDKCGTQYRGKRCQGVPTTIISGLIPGGEEVAVCRECLSKFLRKKNRSFNFVAKSINRGNNEQQTSPNTSA